MDDLPELTDADVYGELPFTEEEMDSVVAYGLIAELPGGPDLDPPDTVIDVVNRELADEKQAAAVMAALRRLEADRLRLIEQADAYRARIDAWVQAATIKSARRAEFLSGTLERYALAVRARYPHMKSFRYPTGDITTKRAKEPKVVVLDEPAVIKWAADTLPSDVYALVVKTVESVLISELRKVVRLEQVRPPHEDEEPAFHVVYGEKTDEGDEREVVPGLGIELPVTTARVTPAL